MTLETGPWQVTNEQYHADSKYISHSGLEEFRESAGRYYGRYITKTIPKRKSTAALVLGSAVDCLLFEPELFGRRFARMKKPDLRTTKGKGLYATITRINPEIDFLDEELCAKLDAMVAAVRSRSTLAAYLAAIGQPQQSLRWVDPETGIACKCRFDLLLASGHALDLKTAIDPSPEGFTRACLNLGYHRQSAFYRTGRLAILGVPLDAPLLHVVAGSEAPHDCAVYELGADEWRLGERQNREDLRRLADCRTSGVWEHTWQVGIYPIAFKPWVFRNE